MKVWCVRSAGQAAAMGHQHCSTADCAAVWRLCVMKPQLRRGFPKGWVPLDCQESSPIIVVFRFLLTQLTRSGSKLNTWLLRSIKLLHLQECSFYMCHFQGWKPNFWSYFPKTWGQACLLAERHLAERGFVPASGKSCLLPEVWVRRLSLLPHL